MLLSLPITHALSGPHALASVSPVVGSSLAGVVSLWMLQHNVLAVAFFPAPMPEKSSRLFRSQEGGLLHSQMQEKSSGPQCWKILVPGARPVLPPWARLLWHGGMYNVWELEDFSGIWECKRSPSRDPTSFMTWGNVKKIYGWREKCPGISSGIGQIFWWELKQKGFFHSVGRGLS